MNQDECYEIYEAVLSGEYIVYHDVTHGGIRLASCCILDFPVYYARTNATWLQKS